MADKAEKCAHVPCQCMPPKGEKYCSQLCKDADQKKQRSVATADIPHARNSSICSLTETSVKRHEDTLRG